MSEPLTPTDGDDDEWITLPKADGVAETITKGQLRARQQREAEGLPPEGSRRGRDWQIY
jgi:hypothetical protein